MAERKLLYANLVKRLAITCILASIVLVTISTVDRGGPGRILSKLVQPYSHEEKSDQIQTVSLSDSLLLAAKATQQGKVAEASQILLDIAPSIAANGDPTLVALLNCSRADVSIRLAEFAQANEYITTCKSNADQIAGLTREDILIEVMHLEGFQHQMVGNYVEAVDHFRSALSLAAVHRGRESLAYARTLNNYANVHYRLGFTKESLELHEQVLAIRTTKLSDHHPLIAASYGNIGNSHHAMGDYGRALLHHRHAETIWIANESVNSIQNGYTQNNIGLALLSLDRYEEAISKFNRSATIKMNALGRSHASLAGTYQLLAQAYSMAGKLDSAVVFIEHAENIYRVSGQVGLPKYSESLRIKAAIFAGQGDHQAARGTFEASLARSDSLHPATSVETLNEFARFEIARSRPIAALDLVNRSVSVNTGMRYIKGTPFNPSEETARDRLRLIEALEIKALAHLEETPPRHLEAIQVLTRALSISSTASFGTSLSHELKAISRTAGRVSELLLRLHTGESFQTVSSAGLEPLHQAVEFIQARALLEAMDFRADLKNLNGSDILVSQLSALEDELRQELNDRSSTEAGPGFSSKSNFRELTLRRSIDSLRESASSFNLRPTPRERIVGVPSAIQIQRSMAPNTSLIRYFEQDDALHAFVISDESITVSPIGSVSEARSLVDAFLNATEGSYSRELLRMSYTLYEFLVAPLFKEIQNDDLTIIASDAVSGLPFEALTTLPVESGNRPLLYHEFPFLLKERNITYGFSTTLLHSQELNPHRESTSLLAIAPQFPANSEYSNEIVRFLSSHLPDAGENPYFLQPLPSAKTEAKLVRMIVDPKSGWKGFIHGSRSMTWIGDSVSEQRFKNQDLSTYRYLHFATHSFADADDPSRSGIILNVNEEGEEDGILYASEVFGLDLDAELVVLSSCEAAKPGAGDGHGLSGFAKGFLYAGAKNLVASLWASDDYATRVLMEEFYSRLAEGEPSDVALRNAKLALINTKSPLAKPYFWAGFIHIGVPSRAASNTATETGLN